MLHFASSASIEAVPGARRYRFVLGAKPSLPDEIVVHACLDHLQRADTSARVISVQRLAQDYGGPGRVFKVTRDALAGALERYGVAYGETLVTNRRGSVQLVVERDPTTQLSWLFGATTKVPDTASRARSTLVASRGAAHTSTQLASQEGESAHVTWREGLMADTLASVVRVRQRYVRSANVERDDLAQAVANYIPTGRSIDVLSRLRAMEHPRLDEPSR